MFGTLLLIGCGKPVLQETKETRENYLGSVKIEPSEARYELREINDQVFVFDNEMARLWLLRQDPKAGWWLKPVMFENESGFFASVPIAAPLELQTEAVKQRNAELLKEKEDLEKAAEVERNTPQGKAIMRFLNGETDELDFATSSSSKESNLLKNQQEK